MGGQGIHLIITVYALIYIQVVIIVKVTWLKPIEAVPSQALFQKT